MNDGIGGKVLWTVALLAGIVVLRTVIGVLMRRTLADGPVRVATASPPVAFVATWWRWT